MQNLKISEIWNEYTPKEKTISLILFFSTILSCSFAGATYQIKTVSINTLIKFFASGLYYSIPLIIILLSHELGHFLMAHKYKIMCTLPYFIPLPISILGTMGAFIKIKSPIYTKKSLFDIGVAGPIAGFILSTIFIIIFLPYSTVQKVSPPASGLYITLGEPLLFKIFSWIYFGNLPQNTDIILHPAALAGWVGYLVTALNLIPIGQLDGGHIIYALFGKKHKLIAYIVYFSLFPMVYFFQGWIAWIIILLILGIKHPPVIAETMGIYEELDKKRKILGYITIIIFFLIFTPQPIRINL